MENSQNSSGLRLQLDDDDMEWLKHVEEHRCYLTKEEIIALYNYISRMYFDPDIAPIVQKMREIVENK